MKCELGNFKQEVDKQKTHKLRDERDLGERACQERKKERKNVNCTKLHA